MKVARMSWFLILFLTLSLSACKKPDNDGMDDLWEKQYGLNPKDPADAMMDKDDDGLSNLDEFKNGTNPTLADSDGDGLKDAAEIKMGTSPTNPDSDGDGDKDNSDCSPLKPEINHNAKEGPINTPTCVDTFDNDCDGAIDQVDSDCFCQSDADCKTPTPCQQAKCEQGLCQLTPLPDGTACDDSNCCTINDKCQAGECVGTSKECPKPKACEPSSCQCLIQNE